MDVSLAAAGAVGDLARALCLWRGSVPQGSNPSVQNAPYEYPTDYRSLFLAAAEGLYRSTPEGSFVDVNPAMAALFGFASPLQMLEATCHRASALYADQAHARHVHRLLNEHGRFQQIRAEVYRSYGTRFWISESARTIRDAEGKVVLYEGSVFDITDLVIHENALKQSEALYRTLIESCQAGVFLIQHGRVVFANHALGDILGYQVAEMIGQDYLAAVEPSCRDEQAVRNLSREAGSAQVFVHELGLVAKDGRRLLLSVCSAGVVFGGSMASTGTVRDITSEREAQRSLIEAERKYRELFENSVVPLFRADPGGRLLDVNRAFLQLVGCDSVDQALVSLGNLKNVFDNAAEHAQLAAMLESLEIVERHEFAVRNSAGEMRRAEFSARIICDQQGRRTALEGSIQDVTARHIAETRLLRDATHDGLTGLPNRHLLRETLQDRLSFSPADERVECAILFLDLDGFKFINDGLGHTAGDLLLVAIAQRFKESLADEALVARYGGDEFVVLPNGRCDKTRALSIARRILHAFDSPFVVLDQEVFSGASIGIAIAHNHQDTPDTMLRNADTAMYRAKKGGKAGISVFDEAMQAAARVRFRLGNDMRWALERGEFEVYFQPIVKLSSSQVVGCEALVRWQHPDRGLLVPADFLSVAEESNVIAKLDWWVLHQACRQLGLWQRRFGASRTLTVNVNLDQRQLGDGRFISRLSDALAANGADPRGLALEVTETVFRNGRSDLQAVFARIKRLGVSLVVDDFGTGYSSLDSFAASPFDTLKIDRVFVHDMETNRRHLAIVRTICGFAEELDLRLTAEGVESPAQAAALIALGCDTAQGFLYAKPAPAQAMDAIFESGKPLAPQ